MTPRRLAAASLAALALLAAGCGDDGGSTSPGPLGADDWRDRVEQYCSDAYQEATALPLPGHVSQVAEDASARAEILATVRDGVLTLGQPDGIDSGDVSAYVDALNADIEQLGQIADAADDGTINPEAAQLDEAAGQAAGAIGLDNCAALSQAIARTP